MDMKYFKIQDVATIFISIVCFSFTFNFLWESLHGYSLYTDHIISSDKYVKMMIYMSFMDALTILAMYVFCTFFMKDIFWLGNLNLKRGAIFFIVGLVVAIGAEYWAVYVTHEWHYNNRMPVVFGIGLSPLVQLSVTGLVSLWLVSQLKGN